MRFYPGMVLFLTSVSSGLEFDVIRTVDSGDKVIFKRNTSNIFNQYNAFRIGFTRNEVTCTCSFDERFYSIPGEAPACHSSCGQNLGCTCDDWSFFNHISITANSAVDKELQIAKSACDNSEKKRYTLMYWTTDGWKNFPRQNDMTLYSFIRSGVCLVGFQWKVNGFSVISSYSGNLFLITVSSLTSKRCFLAASPGRKKYTMNGKKMTTLPKTIIAGVSSTRAKIKTTINATTATTKTITKTATATTTTTITKVKPGIIITASQNGLTTKQILQETEKSGEDGNLSMRLFTLIGLPLAILLSLLSISFWLWKIYRKTKKLSTPETTNPQETNEIQHHSAEQIEVTLPDDATTPIPPPMYENPQLLNHSTPRTQPVGTIQEYLNPYLDDKYINKTFGNSVLYHEPDDDETEYEHNYMYVY